MYIYIYISHYFVLKETLLQSWSVIMRRVTASASLARSVSAFFAMPYRAFTRGIPYAPQGTIQDFTSSPRHGRLAELQRNLDISAGRAPTHLYEGPTVTTKDGPRPLFDDAATHNPRPTAAGAPPSSLPHLPLFAAQSASRMQMMPPPSDNYQQDLRRDPSQAETPEHIVAARQRIATMQSDSFGESPRGMVAPPPPLDPNAPREYIAPRVQLDDSWWLLMWAFVFLFVLMAKFGK